MSRLRCPMKVPLYCGIRRFRKGRRAGSRNIRFSDAVAAAKMFGFSLLRINGSHHIFVHPEVSELVNLQDVNGKAKPYQVKQLLQLVERYDLTMESDE